MKSLPSALRASGCALLAACASSVSQGATATLLDVNFNDGAVGYSGWGSTALTGSPGNGVSTIYPVVPSNPAFVSPLFSTAPTSGYLALTPNASAVTPATYFGGWAANVTLPAVNSPYSAGGLGQTDPSKISLTARVRARGMPVPNGAVVILEIRASGDNPGAPTSGYKRIRFEPTFLAGNDWTTIGGTFDTAGLTAAKGSIYNFPLNAAQYSVLVEASGFNRFVGPGYVAYNTPTGASNGGRKNPGFDFTGGIRIEVDDVKLVVTDPATTGFIAPTTPSQLLRNGNFNTGDANWTFFEGAYVASDPWSEDSSMFALIPGWSGTAYAGFLQSQIEFSPSNGDFFTATFRAKFEENYEAGRTIVAFMDGPFVTTFVEIDLNDEIAPRLGQWHTYSVSFRPTPAQLAAMNGKMSFKIQPLERVRGAAFSSVLIDNVVLTQATASAVGPQIALRVAGATRSNGETATFFNPTVGRVTPYEVRISNNGAETLNVTSVTVGGSQFALGPVSLPISLAPGEARLISLSVNPTAIGPLTGTLTVVSNDKEVPDRNLVINLAATAITLSDTFNGSETLPQLGWLPYASTPGLAAASTYDVSGGNMVMNVNSSADDYPWAFIGSKLFASPGEIDLANSSLLVTLRAEGLFPGLPNNKVQVRLESLNAAGNVTGSIALGAPVDETTANSLPGTTAYFTPDGINDRVVVSLPEGGGFTTVGGTLSSTGVNAGFDPDAPAFRLVVHMTDFDFDIDAGNIVQVDSIMLNLGTKAFILANGSFESNATDPGTGAAPTSWLQFPIEGVSKNIVFNGASVYNASLGGEDAGVLFSAYAGTRALKVYGQNYYPGGVWQGPSQTGTVYQEFHPATTTSLAPGTVVHARTLAKVYSIDPLTGGSTFNFGFKYLNASDVEIGRDVTTLTAANAPLNQWRLLVANGTIPAGTTRLQVISEFVQNASTDAGSVYLDDMSVGFGGIVPTVDVGGTPYSLVWSDEFDGNELNTANWTPEIGNGVNGWGNGEVQNYTSNPENLRVENGSLIIEARKTGSDWTSARIKTQGKRSFLYGKIEFRAKLPTGVGPWPAAWMMGENISTVGWPACGEIDVMEWRGTEPNRIGHATHSPSRHGGNPVEVGSNVANVSTQFNTYAVVWAPNQVTFSVNGNVTGSWSTAFDSASFQSEFFILLNMAIGGAYLGYQIDPLLTSALYEVDYVRVYQGSSAPPLSAYQQYLQAQGLPTDTSFEADANSDGVPEGLAYAIGGVEPKLAGGAAALAGSAGTYTYTFDVRNDATLNLVPEVSTTLTSWGAPTTFSFTDLAGAPEGFIRKRLNFTMTATDRVFVRLRITQ